LLGKDGKETGVRFKGELFDISRGGVSFFMRVSKKKNADMLFGNKIRITLPTGGGRQQDFSGIIVAVRGHHVVSNEYSVHVRFASQLASQKFLEIIGGT
ncbi:MAG: PilZ domain-containing protein, partial [Desulfopila sp.]|nr:PilZ domain-containing protein [Desulfopila sp.]